jgi:hypothetical protein
VDLLLRVNAGRRYRIQQVRFSGAPGLEASELKQALRATRVRRALGLWKLRPAFSDAVVNSDLARLKSLFLARGYFDARVAISSVEYAGERVTVTYSVQSGPQYIVADQRSDRPGATLTRWGVSNFGGIIPWVTEPCDGPWCWRKELCSTPPACSAAWPG